MCVIVYRKRGRNKRSITFVNQGAHVAEMGLLGIYPKQKNKKCHSPNRESQSFFGLNTNVSTGGNISFSFLGN